MVGEGRREGWVSVGVEGRRSGGVGGARSLVTPQRGVTRRRETQAGVSERAWSFLKLGSRATTRKLSPNPRP